MKLPQAIASIEIQVGKGKTAPVLKFHGRDAWTLARLIESGKAGVTPIERPAPRWSEYVRRLRESLSIETVEEKHGGPYKGTHGRYVLRSPVRVVSFERAKA